MSKSYRFGQLIQTIKERRSAMDEDEEAKMQEAETEEESSSDEESDSEDEAEIKEIERLKMLSPHLIQEFQDLPISKKTIDGLKKCGITIPSYMQKEVLNFALRGRDINVTAPRGSGKTLAYLIAVLEKLFMEKWPITEGLGALIITPKKRTALRILAALHKISIQHAYSADLLLGNKYFLMERNRKIMLNIIIGTPEGIVQQKDASDDKETLFDLRKVKIVVLDNVDRMFNQRDDDYVREIIRRIPSDKQTLMFSTRQTKKVEKFVQNMSCPVSITVPPRNGNQSKTMKMELVPSSSSNTPSSDALLSMEPKEEVALSTTASAATNLTFPQIHFDESDCDSSASEDTDEERERIFKSIATPRPRKRTDSEAAAAIDDEERVPNLSINLDSFFEIGNHGTSTENCMHEVPLPKKEERTLKMIKPKQDAVELKSPAIAATATEERNVSDTDNGSQLPVISIETRPFSLYSVSKSSAMMKANEKNRTLPLEDADFLRFQRRYMLKPLSIVCIDVDKILPGSLKPLQWKLENQMKISDKKAKRIAGILKEKRKSFKSLLTKLYQHGCKTSKKGESSTKMKTKKIATAMKENKIAPAKTAKKKMALVKTEKKKKMAPVKTPKSKTIATATNKIPARRSTRTRRSPHFKD